MGRRGNTLDGTILGRHLGLGVAAHLARTQLVPDPLKPYDAQHLGESLDAVARALAKVAPLYVLDAQSGTTRELVSSELEGASITHGGNRVALRDGSVLSSVCIRRTDLRQAIALLRKVSIAELGAPQQKRPGPDPCALLAEVEALLQAVPQPAGREQVSRLLIALARCAPPGPAANLAMRLMTALCEGEEFEPLLARLHGALQPEQPES